MIFATLFTSLVVGSLYLTNMVKYRINERDIQVTRRQVSINDRVHLNFNPANGQISATSTGNAVLFVTREEDNDRLHPSASYMAQDVLSLAPVELETLLVQQNDFLIFVIPSDSNMPAIPVKPLDFHGMIMSFGASESAKELAGYISDLAMGFRGALREHSILAMTVGSESTPSATISETFEIKADECWGLVLQDAEDIEDESTEKAEEPSPLAQITEDEQLAKEVIEEWHRAVEAEHHERQRALEAERQAEIERQKAEELDRIRALEAAKQREEEMERALEAEKRREKDMRRVFEAEKQRDEEMERCRVLEAERNQERQRAIETQRFEEEKQLARELGEELLALESKRQPASSQVRECQNLMQPQEVCEHVEHIAVQGEQEQHRPEKDVEEGIQLTEGLKEPLATEEVKLDDLPGASTSLREPLGAEEAKMDEHKPPSASSSSTGPTFPSSSSTPIPNPKVPTPTSGGSQAFTKLSLFICLIYLL